MIDEIRATNVALIEDAQICPAPSLTVLTGETGAGKTALLNALKLLVGERAESSSVREGTEGLLVEGRVFLDDDPDGIVVRRSLSSDGRGRVEIDGAMASVRELATKIGSTVDLCGQHEHQRLLSVASHVEMLDAWIGAEAQLRREAYQLALKKSAQAAAELERVRALNASGAEALEEAQFVLARIDEVAPQAGELEELKQELSRAEHAALLVRNTEAVREALSSDGGVIDLLGQASGLLVEAVRHDATLESSYESLESSIVDLDELARTLRSYRDSLDFDPEALDRMQQRLSQIQGLLRSYGPSMEELFARREQAAELLAATNDYELVLAQATRAFDEAEAEVAAAGLALDELRQSRAPEFAAELNREMAKLEMGSAYISIAFESLERPQWSAAGPSHVEFMFAPGAALSARPLKKIASGGELSRVALATKLVSGRHDVVETIVFDEVDAGVGGATAKALAQAIFELAQTHQVIVVTHLAQLAVMAKRHYLVSKHDDDTHPVTHITQIDGEQRVAEIARMLSGDTGELARAHASELLGQAQAQWG
ncbi:MAG: DNA repair protein RecN [Atopobiaceae bacterium]|nr:DNA repair protein RecN [Atopobiaceae bacterium]